MKMFIFVSVFLLCASISSAMTVTNDMVNYERNRLQQGLTEQLNRCKNNECVNRTKQRISKKMEMLNQAPELYFKREYENPNPIIINNR